MPGFFFLFSYVRTQLPLPLCDHLGITNASLSSSSRSSADVSRSLGYDDGGGGGGDGSRFNLTVFETNEKYLLKCNGRKTETSAETQCISTSLRQKVSLYVVASNAIAAAQLFDKH